MRIIALVALAVLSGLASPAFACKNLAKYPEHLWGSTAGWWQPYRVVHVVEAHDEHFVVIVKQSFGDKADIGKRTALQFMANEEAHAMCAISLAVGRSYLVKSMSGAKTLTIQRFNHMNMPSTHPRYDGYLRDLEKAEVRPMYVEANEIITGTRHNRDRVVLRGKVELHYNNFFLFADQLIDDRGANELVAEGHVYFVNPDRSVTQSERLRLPDNYRDTFRSIQVEKRSTPWE